MAKRTGKTGQPMFVVLDTNYFAELVHDTFAGFSGKAFGCHPVVPAWRVDPLKGREIAEPPPDENQVVICGSSPSFSHRSIT